MQRGAWAILIGLVLAAGALAYGEYVLPGGIVSGPQHELANVIRNDSRITVDKNLNGIVDEAESCPTCPVPTSVGPSGAIYGARGQLFPGGIPVQVPSGASITHFRITGGCQGSGTSYNGLYGGNGYYSAATGTLIDIVIDWNARSIKGFLLAHQGTTGQGQGNGIVGGVGRWNVQNAQSNVPYFHDAPSQPGEICIWNGWCNSIQLDFQNRRITKMPLYSSGCDLISGSMESA